MGIPLLDFLSGEDFQLNYSLNRIQSIQQSKSKKNKQVADLELAEKSLKTILSINSQPPLSMSDIAKQLGYHRRTLTRRFPELTTQISARYLEYKKMKRIEQIREYCLEVEEAVIKLNDQGIYPSESNVSKLISKPGNFREKEVRDALKKARQKLGIKR